jgi:cell division topological specificity factor
MIDFFKRIFGIQPPASGATAKERLRLVLLSDHLSLAPDVIESLKRDLLEVISRYVEIDESHADVTFEHRDREIAMLASVPIRAVLGRTLPPPARPAAPAPSNGAPVLVEAPPAVAVAPAEPAVASAAPEELPESVEPEAEPAAPPAVVEPVPALALVPEPAAEASPEQPAEFAQMQPAPKPSTSSTRRRRRRKKAAAAAAAGPLQMTASQF